MPHRDWSNRVEDILEACRRIVEYVEGMDELSFANDQRTVDAVVRNLTVLGEAVKHLPEELLDRHSAIPWIEMRGIRNVMVHEYFGVSIPIIWKTCQNDIPPLIPLLEKVLETQE